MAIRLPRILWLIALALLPSPLAAADPTTLTKAPADVEYYSSTLRLGETIEMVSQSRAWKLIWEDPAVQELRKKALTGMAGKDFEPFHQFMANPDNAALPGLAADALSHEMFFYTGAGTGDVVALMQEVFGAARFGGLAQQLQGRGQNAAEAARGRMRMILQMLAEKPERIRIPDLMIGFKVSDPAKVTKQLERLDPILAEALKNTPLAGKAERKKLGDDGFLVLTLDGSLVPWDKIPLDEIEEKDGEFAPLIKRLKAMKLSIAIGVRQGYLLLCIGGSTDAVLKFGGDGPKLVERPELKPLAKASSQPLLSINYTSAKLRQSVATTAEDIQGMADLAKSVLPFAVLPGEIVEGLEKDMDKLAQSAIKGLVKPEAAFDYSYRTDRGWETFGYDLTPAGGSSKQPLTLLDHLGGNPILAGVWRSETNGDDYKAQVKWITIIADHGEKILRAKVPDAEPMIDEVRKEIFPLLRELNETTEKLWLPALADGQSAIVIDAKWSTKQWHEMLGKTDREMPIPEFAIILGVSDADKLGQALGEYRKTANKLIAKARAMAPPDAAIPAFEIPNPKIEEKDGRKYAWYPFPKEWGFDPKLQPTGGVGGSVAALALSRGHVDRLLTPTALPNNLVPLADRKKPLDSAFIFNGAELVTAAGPWVTLAIQQAPPSDKNEAERIAGKAMSLLKVFHCYSTASWRENGTRVTQSEMIIRDVPAK